MRLDSKVHGTLVKNKDGKEIPEDEFVVFRPHDDAFWDALCYYRNRLVVYNASVAQLEATDALLDRVRAWRDSHPDRCKVADVALGELRT
jgi:hypothetical protein